MSNPAALCRESGADQWFLPRASWPVWAKGVVKSRTEVGVSRGASLVPFLITNCRRLGRMNRMGMTLYFTRLINPLGLRRFARGRVNNPEVASLWKPMSNPVQDRVSVWTIKQQMGRQVIQFSYKRHSPKNISTSTLC